jgi:hypothetical protein
LLTLNDFECVDVVDVAHLFVHILGRWVLSRYVLAQVVRAPDAQVLLVLRSEGPKVGQTVGMWAVSKDYYSIGDYGETATQKESPSLPKQPNISLLMT